MFRFTAALYVLLVLPMSAPAALAPDGAGRVVEIVDGDTLVLEDGREVRLVGIQAPKLPLGRPNFKAWPLADDAKAALEELAQDKVVSLSYGGRRVDRYKRQLAHLHDSDGVWIQAELLRLGMARVYSFADNRAVVSELLAFEQEARRARRGIWRHPFYYVRDAMDLAGATGGFHIVEGTVKAVATVRQWTYLNFGDDWRSDFTVSIGAKVRRLFPDTVLNPANLEGRRIRVRGWVQSRNGPMIEATHPEQIEFID
ncbi:MAG: thermonuclease family protein [Proteobacteria bacterium]|nr:thermonuclease family protein [Pseudomonadota bacterium]